MGNLRLLFIVLRGGGLNRIFALDFVVVVVVVLRTLFVFVVEFIIVLIVVLWLLLVES